MQGAVHACQTARARVCSETMGWASIMSRVSGGCLVQPGEKWKLYYASVPAAALIRLGLYIELLQCAGKHALQDMSCIWAGWGLDAKGCILETDLKR